ncbi:Cyn operon transcriptional activator [Variovorax sp. PBS-H4]|uniref:LysR family transcriptional regulator n=1 Tax=Variovorax sp. PBS-H4 TaxID=434008 RepID=UPI0013199D43|nr:LysR family transcriptional regulator [Variovorax sp. PBS-H4]VTU40253.1 Cyn operon transcriptional activator [Variovorax sp. PBS-H4]
MNTNPKSFKREERYEWKAELRLVSSNALKYFVGVVKAGSMRRAAEELHVAASAISRLIHLLEEELGAELLERHRGQKGAKLTPEGEVVLKYAMALEAGLEAVRDDIQSLKAVRRGKVKLGISESFTRDFVPQFLQRFHAEYPGITFEVTVAGGNKLTEMVANQHIDVSLSYITPDTFNVSVVAQAMTTPCLLVARSHPFAQRDYVDISECAGEDIALPDASLTIRESYVRMFAKAKIRPRGLLVTNSFELMRASAGAGLAVAIVDRYFGDHQAPARMKYVPLRGQGLDRWPLNVSVHADRSLPSAAAIFVERLCAAVRAVAAVKR